jgi:hypothetical protein
MEPICNWQMMEARIVEGVECMPKHESPDDKRAKHLTDSAEPIAALDETLSCPQALAQPQERTLSDEPRVQNDTHDIPSPSRTAFRTENEEPKATNCITDVPFPARA